MVHLLIRRLNDVKLRDKMLLSFVLFMVLPLAGFGVFFIQEFRTATLKEALDQAEQQVSRLQAQAMEVLGIGLRISERLAVDPGVETLATAHYESTLDVFRAYSEFETFRLFRAVNPEVTGIQVYADNPTVIDNWEIRPLTPAIRASAWFEAARRHPNVSGWFSWKDPTKSSKARLSLVRYLPFPLEKRPAVMVIDLDTSRLDNVLGPAGFETLVLDTNLWVVASNRSDQAGRPLSDPRLLSLVSGPGTEGSGSFERDYRGTRSFVFLRDLTPSTTFNGLTIACVVNPEVILRTADRISTLGLIVLVIGTLVSLLFLGVVYTLLARRLEALSRQLPLVAAGDFDRVLTVDGADELGQLAKGFNSMVSDIRGLLDEVREGHEAQRRLERAQGEIRLKMLSSQINPHFLFNVLESVRMKAHLSGEKEIASTVKLLGRLMRRNLEASGGHITLGEELENVRCYLAIEKFRLEEKLDFHIDLGLGAETILVPPLIVEPLVENAVVHGLEPHYGPGRIVVRANLDGRFLLVEVSDNGVGMSSDLPLHLLSRPEGHHVGLRNIHQRLTLQYGDAAGLSIDTAPGAGTRVVFRIPIEGQP